MGIETYRSPSIGINRKSNLSSRYWRYCYRYGGKRRTLSLGLYPEVPVDRARSRHLAARQLLAAGVDPSLKREELRGPFRLRRR